MIERLARALEHLEELPEEAQEELADLIEQYERAPDEGATSAPRRRSYAGIWSDLPDDMEDTLPR